MKINASSAPDKNFCVETIPNKPGFVLVRFFENIQKQTDEESQNTTYTYDEYRIKLPYYKNIALDIEANFNNMIGQAKIEEEQKNLTMENLKAENEKLKAELSDSQNTIINLQVALCDFYESVL